MLSELPPRVLDAITRRLGSFSDPQRDIPRAAKDPVVVEAIEEAVRSLVTSHVLHRADARAVDLTPGSVHLVVTSPPYWTLKRYNETVGQLGHTADYETFLEALDDVWARAFDALVPGGRLVCVVGDVLLSRRKAGRHMVIPLHASIQEHARRIGYDNLAPIFWYKISNAKHEVDRGSGGFLGKPYEPNGVVKHDVEYVLMLRKPGGYRSPAIDTRLLSVIPETAHRRWFQQVWTDVAGVSTRNHPAPFPLELAERLVRMFSFVGDTVLDPFAGTGTSNVAAAMWGRNSIGIEVDETYCDAAAARLRERAGTAAANLEVRGRRISRLAPISVGTPASAEEAVSRGVPAA